jgi:GNAT superfamily N-acetyltransferase
MTNPFGITKRHCKVSDFKFFANLIEKTLRKYIEAYFPFDKNHVKQGFYEGFKKIIILMKGKRRIGLYQITEHNSNTLEITRIFLIPSYQKKGIGTWHMKHFETLGYNKIILEVWDNNPAQFLYKKLGYKTVKKKNHKIHMEKILKSKTKLY